MTVVNLNVEYNEYDTELLEHLHKVLIEMFKDFDEICKKNNINYFIYFGTNIGAIRHKGFIPWDDEIDIGLIREDYEKLIQILEKENDKYYISNWKHIFGVDDSCYTPKTLFCLKNTRLKAKTLDSGIYIDLNVLDDIPENKIQKFIFIKIIDLTYLIMGIKGAIQTDLYVSRSREIIGHLISFIFKYIDFPNIFAKIFTKLIKKFQGKSKYLCNINSYYYMAMPKEYFTELIPIKFEDMKVKMPVGYDSYLRLFYGDYMKMPPKHERITHDWEIIDFGDY